MTTIDEYAAGLPLAIRRLDELAYNLWWCWQPDAQDLFARIDSDIWRSTNHNPVATLRRTSPSRLAQVAADPDFLAHQERVLAAFDTYLDPATPTWFAQTYPGDTAIIAYFCMEFGLHECLPVYAGGLGVLAGDHCKTASDLGLPFVAIGLWYPHGYFRQQIDPTSGQAALPEVLDLGELPVLPALFKRKEVYITLELTGRPVQVQVLQVRVGRIRLLLLNTDLPANSDQDRALCSSLYGGDRETRVGQEFVLGIGGVRALRAMDIHPARWHMNEGHAGFMGLERIREAVQSGVPFVDAWPEEAEATVFTTHTPVPAGNEVFRNELIARYLADFPTQMSLDAEGMLRMAHEEGAPDGTFAMTPLALRLSHRANGVSALHGAVARKMWAKQYPELTEDQVPISSITNGVHTASWVAPVLREFFARYLAKDWLDRVDDQELWQALSRIPDVDLWSAHRALKMALIDEAARRVVTAQAAGADGAARQPPILDPHVLTIGFARRFATYKRATLFFHDLERARRILADPLRPVQLVFAGKAHPADKAGQDLIKSIVDLSDMPEFAGRVFFLEGYDIGLARYLVQGVDLWLNNPERPQEASGTSGEKASLNGVPNCSVRDGWWDEAFNGRNGWAFGGAVGNDDIDSGQLYEVLEQSVIPTYYDRNAQGIPSKWVAVMREAIRTIAPAFSAQRMLKEYTTKMYR